MPLWVQLTVVAAMLAALEVPVVAEARREHAEALLHEGNALHDRKDYVGALQRYRQARALYPSPRIDFNMALTLQAMGSSVEAAERFERFLAVHPDEPRTSRVAREGLETLRRALGRITLRCPLSGARVTVDGVVCARTPAPTALYVKPGPHELTVTASGHARYVRAMSLAAGEQIRVAVTLVPLQGTGPSAPEDAAPPPRPASTPFYKTWWFWTVVGVVVAGGVVGGVFAARTGGEPGVGPGELEDITVTQPMVQEVR